MAADANFRIADSELVIASEICRRVDGLPLAIEMVAGWAGPLGLATLDAKLDQSLNKFLRAGSTAPPRHSTMRATLDWSYGLLCAAEQTVLCRLAVFAGAFSMEAAETVAGDDRIPKDQIFEHVAGLVRKSMIGTAPGPPAQGYRLLQTTRAFMLEKLAASGNARVARQRHAHHVLRALEKAKCEWEVTSDAVWLRRYSPMLDDLRAALDWATAEDGDEFVALAGASWPLLRELSLAGEARERLRAAAARLCRDTPPALEARLRHGLGVMLLNTAAMKAALEELARTVILYRTLGDANYLGSSLVALGYALFMLGRIGEAEGAIAEALDLLKSSGWLRTLSTVYFVKMHIEATLGRFDAADLAERKASDLCRMAGAGRTALVVSADAVQLALQRGDVDGAISGAHDVTSRLRDTPHLEIRGLVWGLLAAAHTERGDLNEALTAAREAAPLLFDEGALFWLFDHLALRATLAGHAREAALIAGYANAVYRKSGSPRAPIERRAVERMTSVLRDALPDDEIAQLGDMGAHLSERQAMSIALGV
jgi:tetratricopeptide (TPR) repeat protein